MCAALYPQVARIKGPEVKYMQAIGGAFVAPTQPKENHFLLQTGKFFKKIIIKKKNINVKNKIK